MNDKPKVVRIRCDSCGYECNATKRQVAGGWGYEQRWVGGQHVCDRFEAGIFRRVRVTKTRRHTQKKSHEQQN